MTAAPERLQQGGDGEDNRDTLLQSSLPPMPVPVSVPAPVSPETARPSTPPSLRARLRTALLPLPSGPQGIATLDGLRAIAALMVLIFHLLLFVKPAITPFSQATNYDWYFLANGVWLFFVLSGFLLFLPYARALLLARPLPSALNFYRRRALRILPAYWVCLAIVALAENQLRRPVVPLNILVHLLMIHDDFPAYNRALEAPFWTLAVESQFYLFLPLLAFGVAWVVGKSRSLARVVAGIVGLIVLALGLQWLDVQVMSGLPQVDGSDRTPGGVFVMATMGMQGKFLPVFAVGMLCAALYVVVIEQRRLSERVTRGLGATALVLSLGLFVVVVPAWARGAVMFKPGATWGWDILTYPLLSGLAFGAFMLALLFGGQALRAVFAWAPLRFIGLISYSLYLWHLPVLQGLVPPFDALSLPLRLVAIPLVSYASYQLIERPFLKRRSRRAPAATPAASPAAQSA